MPVQEISRPAAGEYAPSFERYVVLVTEPDVLEVLARQEQEVRARLAGLSPARAGSRYAPGKWSVREVLGHVIDTERVFGYRALCVARGEQQDLPPFDENAYAVLAGAEAAGIDALVEEFAALRRSHLAMFGRLPGEAWMRTGRSNGRPLSVRAQAWIMAGHLRHHLRILAERYGC